MERRRETNRGRKTVGETGRGKEERAKMRDLEMGKARKERGHGRAYVCVQTEWVDRARERQ